MGSKSKQATMSENKAKEDNKSVTDVSDDEIVEQGKTSLFQRLFAPDSVETDVSDDSEYDSQDSRSHFTDVTGSHDEDDDEEHDDSTAERSTTSSVIQFDKDLRTRHRAACKNMTVSQETAVTMLLRPPLLMYMMFFST
jgi:hypothetical protein